MMRPIAQWRGLVHRAGSSAVIVVVVAVARATVALVIIAALLPSVTLIIGVRAHQLRETPA